VKALLRITAALAFVFPFVSGVALLGVAIASDYQDGLIPGAIGPFLVGNAFFAGAMLLVVAEKFGRNETTE
jgi:hypothetical protein